MKSLLRVSALALMVASAACAFAKGGDQSLASPGEPHAVISTAWPPGPSYFPARIVWLDGNYLSNQNRDSFWVKPGKHKIGFRAVINSNRGPSFISSPATSAAQDLATLTIELEPGYRYYFAAEIPTNGSVSQWKPVLIKKEK